MNSKIEEELERSGKILQTTIGNSMEPMLRNRQNIVVIEKADGLLKKYDLPLYRRPNGKYVLHRILKVRKNDYIICGDNRIRRETVPESWRSDRSYLRQGFQAHKVFRLRQALHNILEDSL